MPFSQAEIDSVLRRTEQLLQTNTVVQALQACWDKTAVLKQVRSTCLCTPAISPAARILSSVLGYSTTNYRNLWLYGTSWRCSVICSYLLLYLLFACPYVSCPRVSYFEFSLQVMVLCSTSNYSAIAHVTST